MSQYEAKFGWIVILFNPNFNEVVDYFRQEESIVACEYIFLFTMTVLCKLLCRKSGNNALGLMAASSVIVVSVLLVRLGLPIFYGIALSVLAPIVMIILFKTGEGG